MSKILKGYTGLQTAAFTQVGTGTFANQCNSVSLVRASNGGAFSCCAIVKAAPATPFTVTMHFINYGTTVAYQGYGPCWSQSSDGKLATYTMYSATTYNFLRINKWNNETTYSAAYVADIVFPLPDARWFKLEDTGTNRLMYMSTDGKNWVQEHTIGRTDFLTANQVGFIVDPYSQACAIVCDHFKIEYTG